MSRLEVTEGMELDGFVYRGCRAENELAQFLDWAGKFTWDTSEEACQLLSCQSSPHSLVRLLDLPLGI
jgi:hypothetical protein